MCGLFTIQKKSLCRVFANFYNWPTKGVFPLMPSDLGYGEVFVTVTDKTTEIIREAVTDLPQQFFGCLEIHFSAGLPTHVKTISTKKVINIPSEAPRGNNGKHLK